MDLSTTYLGMTLRTPLVPAASPLSADLDNVRQMEDAGAAAIVFYSLFEEQFRDSTEPGQTFRSAPEQYLEKIHQAKETVRIPIIGSLNGATVDGWTRYAKKIEEAGADALELNLYSVPSDADMTGAAVEQNYLDTVAAVKSATKLPVAVKLSPYFSNFANVAKRMIEASADALVIFNRFYQPDIDLMKMEVTPNLMLSSPTEMRVPLRWIAILYGRYRASLAATTGIHQSSDVIKMLLVGADVTMLCSVLLRRGIQQIAVLEKELAGWLTQHGYESVSEVKGMMSQKNCADPSAFERAQYTLALSTYEPLFLMAGRK